MLIRPVVVVVSIFSPQSGLLATNDGPEPVLVGLESVVLPLTL